MTPTSGPKFGLIFPTNEIGSDPEVVREYARRADYHRFRYALVFDHVVGADITGRPNWPGPYTVEHQFHEPFVLLSFLAAISRLELMTGVLILPQRQTVLVAKQAAALDVLSAGRLCLGVGTGWNTVEYESLGVPFGQRRDLFEEQITLLRLLWTQEVVDFSGQFHRVERAGIAPLPVQRPIPIWMGGWSRPAVLDRIGRVGDGWICHSPLSPEIGPRFARIREAARQAGRDPLDVELEGMVQPGPVIDMDQVRADIDSWIALGASRISISANHGDRSPAEHLEFIDTIGSALADVLR